MTNRTLCDVLKEMRACDKTRNYALLESLIEEAQGMGNRMEAALWDQKDIKRYRSMIKGLKKRIKKLSKKEDKLEESNDM